MEATGTNGGGAIAAAGNGSTANAIANGDFAVALAADRSTADATGVPTCTGDNVFAARSDGSACLILMCVVII